VIPVLPLTIDRLIFQPGGRPIIDGLSARITTGGITGLIGPNGAGKSVTLRLLDGVLEPDSGTIRFGASGAVHARRAFVFQRPALVRSSVADNVRLALLPAGLRSMVVRERVRAALERVGLASRAGDPARKLSGGEQQRLALARAWVTEPDLLLLDEPTANLDPGATEAIERLVGAMAAAGAKVILVSHNLGQVARLAEDVLVLDGGRVVEHGPVTQVLQAPRSPQARSYIKGELPWTSFAAAS
jgi:tungstate transport system ATP-binding protein